MFSYNTFVLYNLSCYNQLANSSVLIICSKRSQHRRYNNKQEIHASVILKRQIAPC